ncbi:MAG: T9SS type A sorting domain-containing protein, partial [Pedobacter sp.]
NGKRNINGVSLKWTSIDEKNVDYIEIWRNERDGMAESINRVKPNNNESSTNTYNYIDKTASNKELYYQLKVVDLDGTFSTSNFIVIPKMSSTNDILVYPNPASRYINVKVEQRQIVKIYNSMGALCLQVLVNEQEPIDISKLPSGVYYLKTLERSAKFIITK